MPVYDRNGLVLGRAFDLHGAVMSTVYDVYGNVISESSESILVPVDRPLTIMSYNVQFWQEASYNGKASRLDEIFSLHSPDILGVQEHSTNAKLDGVTPIGDYLSSRFASVELGGKTSSGGTTMQVVASRLDLTDATTVYYDESRYHNYQKMYVKYGGVKIAVFNTHLYWGGNSSNGYGAETRRVQAEKLFAAAEQEEYAIIIGDLNVLEKSTGSADYINIMKRFVDAGYNCANCTEAAGFLETCFEVNGGVFETFPTDNIITSHNIRIDEVVVDYTKNNGVRPTTAMDHMPLVAKLTVLVDPAKHENLLDKDGATMLTSDGENILVVKED